MKWFLLPFSILFFIGIRFRNLFFNLKIFKSRSVSKPVICVGNLTTGGTGKTPWVQFICEHLEKTGKKVLIVSRGYGGLFSGIMEVLLESNPEQCGDEPLWLKQKTKSLVYVGKNRFAATKKALSKQTVDIVLMDDGYQHRQMKRDLNIVLLDATTPFHHYFIFPVGRMRENFSSLKRANILIITKCNHTKPENVKKLIGCCSPYISRTQIFFSDYIFKKWVPLFDNFSRDFKKERLSVACALGNPHGFLETIHNLDIEPVKKFIFRDHYFWKPHDIKKIIKNMNNEKSFDLLITAKDAVKLLRYKQDFYSSGIQLWICSMEIKLRDETKKLFSKINDLSSHGGPSNPKD